MRTGLIITLILLFFASGCTTTESGVKAPFVPGEIPWYRNSKMIQVSSYDTTGGNNDRINIHPGQTAEILNVDGPGVITRIWITIDSRDPYFLRRILVRMYWDGEKNPSVEVPVGDLFGSGFGYNHYTARYTGMSSGGYYLYFPMPFREQARIEIVNETGQEIYAFYYQINYYRMEESLPSDTPYFHARWRRDIRTEGDSNFVALEAEGSGYYVGMNFNGQPYDGSLFYLEGDEMIYVDGEATPSIHGTGFEDYFTSGWYFQNGKYDAPYHGLVSLDQETGRVTAYRHHIPDAIPFERSIRVTYEHGHGNEAVADFSVTSYWYQTEPHRNYEPILKSALRIPLRRPVPVGAVDAQRLEIEGTAKTRTVDMSDFGADWLNHDQLEVRSSYSGATFSLTKPDAIEKAYDVHLYMTKGPQYGSLEIYSGGELLTTFDGYAAKTLPAEVVQLNNLKPVDDRL